MYGKFSDVQLTRFKLHLRHFFAIHLINNVFGAILQLLKLIYDSLFSDYIVVN